jgi:hypothetical protein
VLYTAAEFTRRIKAKEGFALNILANPKLFVIGTVNDLGKFAGDSSPASV